MPWIRAVTAISVVVARMMPSKVRKLRSLFLRNESSAIRVASQKEALGRNCRLSATRTYLADEGLPVFVPFKFLKQIGSELLAFRRPSGAEFELHPGGGGVPPLALQGFV